VHYLITPPRALRRREGDREGDREGGREGGIQGECQSLGDLDLDVHDLVATPRALRRRERGGEREGGKVSVCDANRYS